jgi:hypothetical protein
LRLVGEGEAPAAPAVSSAPAALTVPIEAAADPRWVLAVRAAESLEGTLLRPEKRDRLLRLGRLLGLTTFDANLVIAIIQDRARRGHAPADCPAAGQDQLAMVCPPRAVQGDATVRRTAQTVWLVGLLIAVELLFVWWFL